MAAFMHLENVSETDNNEKQGQDYWKNKYLKLLEKYNQLLERGL
jgi:hypothetical protein